MDDRFNTIAGWVLFAGIVALGSSIVAGEMFKSERPEKMGYPIAGVEQEGEGGAAAEQPIEVYLAKADPAKGQQIFNKCMACHNAEKGGPNQLGPNLWGVLGEPIGQGKGFAFSDALSKKGGMWNWVDSFHTGYVLESLHTFVKYAGDRRFRPALEKGYRFFIDKFFGDDGTPHYYHYKMRPLDIQCASQGIQTLINLHRLHPRSVPTAIKVAQAIPNEDCSCSIPRPRAIPRRRRSASICCRIRRQNRRRRCARRWRGRRLATSRSATIRPPKCCATA